jgi:hypothetical protein
MIVEFMLSEVSMKLRCVVFLFSLVYTIGYSQLISPAFNEFTVSRSAITFGAGSQGVALDGGLDAMQYNPAAIASLSAISFESGKRDAFIIDPAYALSWYRLGFYLHGIGAFALEYNQIDFGDFVSTRMSRDNPLGYEDSTTFRYIERSYALSYAAGITGSLSVGGTIRYIHTAAVPEMTVNQFLFSGGILYNPAEFGNHLSVGFSLIDFGAPVRYKDQAQGDPAPAYMRLGVAVSPIFDDHQKLTFLFEGSRLVADVDDQDNARSSFAALFSSFKYWPHDIMGHGGLIYSFPNIAVTGTMSFHQQLAFGVYDQTIHSYGNNQMSASAVIGVSCGNYTIDVGVASVWRYISESVREGWFPKSIPDEELEMKLSYSPAETLHEPGEKIKMTVTAGIGALSPLGRLKDEFTGSGMSYGIELAQYITPSAAIVSSFSFERNKIGGILNNYGADGTWYTYTISMMYRYDLSEQWFPIYLQAGPTLFRLSYSSSSPYFGIFPRYKYAGGITAGAGITIEIDKFVIIPYIDVISMLSSITGSTPRLGGYNQWSYGIKLGAAL